MTKKKHILTELKEDIFEANKKLREANELMSKVYLALSEAEKKIWGEDEEE